MEIITNLYADHTGIVTTKHWTTAPFHLSIGVFQGDPLSESIFNTVMNTLVDTLSEHRSLATPCHSPPTPATTSSIRMTPALLETVLRPVRHCLRRQSNG